MKVLAIETSCDETGIAIVRGENTAAGLSFQTLGNALISQAALHAQYGGVYPTLAKREHEKNLPLILSEALKIAEERGTDAEIRGKNIWAEVDAIVVTAGPGLEPALWTGIEFSKKVAAEYQKPLFGVNHMEGHLISSLVQEQHADKPECVGMLSAVRFPLLGLLVSGGHTEFVLARDWFRYEIVGRTLDDAVGEAFDKVARMLGLPYPGGPHISRLAKCARNDAERTQNHAETIKLPRPMLNSNSCDMSFSGLKTAALYALRDKGGIQNLSEEERAAFAREFEDAVTEVLVTKSRGALERTQAKTFVIGGGVAANAHIRTALERMAADEFPDVSFKLPELAITGDNAVMIAQAALAHLLTGDWKLGEPPSDIRAQGNLSISA